MNKCDIDKIHSKYTKNNRLIYSISRQLSINEIEEIVRKCEVDFFSIDTVMFENVKIYYTMINQIRDACEKYNKIIGIIAELCGRKIKVYNIYIDGDSTDDMVDLQKGEIVKIKWTGMRPKKSEKKNSQKTIYVNFRDLDDLVSIEDEIIINDNRGCLKVIEKKEKEVKLLDRVRHKSTTKHKTHYYSSRMNNKQLENIKLDNSNNIENQNINNSSRKSKVGTSSYDHINSNGKKIEKMFDLDEKLRSQFKHDNQNYFIRKSSFIFTNQIVEKIEDNSKEIPHNNTIDTRSFRVKSDSRSSVIKYLKCEVKYDCKISKNSFLFVPNADYKSLGIDLLSSREVNEINHLNNMGVHFICITIKDMDDIDSIKEVLSQDSKIRIIANIPDFAVNYYFIIIRLSNILMIYYKIHLALF